MKIGSDQVPYTIFVKLVFRASRRERVYRLFRVVWARKHGPVAGKGWTSKFSVSLWPKLFHWQPQLYGWYLGFCGIRLHYLRSYGGWLS